MIEDTQTVRSYVAASAFTQPVPSPLLRVEGGSKLSKREKETLLYASRGFTSHKIAEMLNLGRETIDTHRRNIMRKLRVNNLTEAVAFGLRNKIIE
jgi:DNA-binding CsgD family transcriptional regulator